MNATRKSVLQGVVKAFMMLVLLINASLTFVFGGTYGSETFPTALPVLSFVLGGLTLTVFYDAASIAWFLARSRDNQSVAQRGIATTLAIASMLASTMVSAIQLAMTTSLVDLSPLYSSVGILGLVMMVLMAAAHFVGVFAYQSADPDFAEADAESAMMAQVNSFRIEQRQEVANKMMAKTQQIMSSQIDAIAEAEAQMLWNSLQAQLYTAAPALPPPAPKQNESEESGQPISSPIVIQNAVPPSPSRDLPKGSVRVKFLGIPLWGLFFLQASDGYEKCRKTNHGQATRLSDNTAFYMNDTDEVYLAPKVSRTSPERAERSENGRSLPANDEHVASVNGNGRHADDDFLANGDFE